MSKNRIEELTPLAQTKFLSLYDAKYTNKANKENHWIIASRKKYEDLKEQYLAYGEDEMRKLPFSEIECITILDRKVIAIDSRGRQYRIQDRLRDLEGILPSYFIRINKSTLANEHRIARFDAVFSGAVDAVFQCGYREYVSRRCFAEIRRRYEGK